MLLVQVAQDHGVGVRPQRPLRGVQHDARAVAALPAQVVGRQIVAVAQRLALDFATVSERVVPFYSLSIRRLLIHRGVDYVQPALPGWFFCLRDADVKLQGALVKTLRAFADADMNVQGAARHLHVHANTIYARLQRIEDVTGLNAQRYHDLTHMLLVADCARL